LAPSGKRLVDGLLKIRDLLECRTTAQRSGKPEMAIQRLQKLNSSVVLEAKLKTELKNLI